MLVAASLMLLGAAMTIVGAFLPWWDASGFTLSGVDILFGRTKGGYRQVHGPGYVLVFLAAVTALLAIAMFVVGRLLSGGIIGIVAGGVSFFFALACLGIVQDTRARLGGGVIAAGVPVAMVGSAASLIGAIMATARRRMDHDPTPVEGTTVDRNGDASLE